MYLLSIYFAISCLVTLTDQIHNTHNYIILCGLLSNSHRINQLNCSFLTPWTDIMKDRFLIDSQATESKKHPKLIFSLKLLKNLQVHIVIMKDHLWLPTFPIACIESVTKLHNFTHSNSMVHLHTKYRATYVYVHCPCVWPHYKTACGISDDHCFTT